MARNTNSKNTEREFPLGLMVTFTERKLDYYPQEPPRLEMRLEVVEKRPTSNAYDFTVGFPSRYSDESRGIAGLRCEVEGSDKYGFYYRGLQFEDYTGSFGIQDLEAMLTSLKAVRRRLDKIVEDEGSASTPGDYLVQIARALRISEATIAFMATESVVYGHYSNSDWAWRPTGQAKDMVNRKFREFAEKRKAEGCEVTGELASL